MTVGSDTQSGTVRTGPPGFRLLPMEEGVVQAGDPDSVPTGGLPAQDVASQSARLILDGPWTILHAEAAERALDSVRLAGFARLIVDLDQAEALDTAGALCVLAFQDRVRSTGAEMVVETRDGARRALFERVRAAREGEGSLPPPVREAVLAKLGRVTTASLVGAVALLTFFGATCSRLAQVMIHPGRLRGRALVSVIERTGLNALPIVGLLSFLIGIVLAYQGADQLRRFGAEILTVNLLGISILRELGVLLTAIIVAGRSGSAFAAQIGTMQINQEIDAMRTLGLDPLDVLVLPRVIGLSLVMPLLAFYASIMALAGGALMCRFALDINLDQFVTQLDTAISPTVFWIGIVKAPVFGLLISLVGCYKGLQVRGSAESVGLLTTEAVVVSIFLVIVVDAVFSIFYSLIGV